MTTVLILSGSVSATLFTWWQIYRRPDPPLMRSVLAGVAAFPVLGPAFALFVLSMPAPRLPAEPLPFQGPVSPHPKNPRWASFSMKVISLVGGSLLALHVLLLLYILR